MSYRDLPSIGPPSHRESLAFLTPRERALYWLAGANFVAFIILGFAVGGDALSGGVEAGKCDVRSDHIRTEVSAFVYYYSLTHILSLFITQPIAVIVGLRARRRARRETEAVSQKSERLWV